ncbi:hypothetical protein TNCV_5001941 [Trichonephila clavipes]|nr:hypothetical protein TNCV_5001941 [Trichonephila clavipes]
MVRAAHSHASRPIETLRKSFTPHHIHKLIRQKNQFRNLYHRTLDPHYKTLYNRAQKNVKKELKNYTNENWTARLQALNTQDNSLWAVQKFFKNKRSDIPSLHCTTGTAITDKQKADILAESILNNFTENERQNNDFDDDDEIVNNTVNAFLSHPPLPPLKRLIPLRSFPISKVLTLKSARTFPQRLAQPISFLLLASMTIIWSDQHKYTGYGMEARFASHMPSNCTEGTEGTDEGERILRKDLAGVSSLRCCIW